MNQESRIFLAGHTGLVGSAILRQLIQQSYGNLLLRSHSELDLTDQLSTRQFFDKEAPDAVILAAAKVGGIIANTSLPADFVYINLAIQTNVIQAAAAAGVKYLLFLGSSCIYPRGCPQPIKEEYLLSGPLEKTNRPYALAKIAGIELCWAFNRQCNTRYLSIMPTNLYGPGDNYDRNYSHVIPGLVRKVHEAKEMGNEEVVVWGSGTPKREFLYSQDLAEACIFLLNKINDLSHELFTDDAPPLINVGVGHDLTIQELSQIIGDVIGYQGRFRFDTTKPDGTPRKLLDSGKLTSYGWNAKTSLVDGISSVYDEFLTRYANSH